MAIHRVTVCGLLRWSCTGRGGALSGVALPPSPDQTTMDNRSITFTLPALPPSMNDLYEPTFRGGRMTGMKMKDGARRWQQAALFYIPRFEITEGATLRTDIEFNFNWSKRRFDCANLCKLVIDTVAGRLGFNDKIVRHGSWCSINDLEREFVKVVLSEIPND